MTRHYLALDLGAESGRAMLARLHGQELTLDEVHRFPNVPVELPTGLYWDTLRLFNDLAEGIRMAAQATEDLDGIAVDTWGVDFGLISHDGELLHMPRHYRDRRTEGTPELVFQQVPKAEIFRHTGVQVMHINSLYQLWVYARDAGDLLERASKLLFMPDLFNYFLTGAMAAERTIASTSQFYNPVTQEFATELLRELNIPHSFLPHLVNPGTPLGPVLPYLAEKCCLRREVTVYTTGAHDTASAVAAVPADAAADWCYISSGTWSLMGVELDAPILSEEACRANFTNEVGVAKTIRFLKNIPGLWVLQECRRSWARAGHSFTYAELMEMAAQAKPLKTVIDLDRFVMPGNHPERIEAYCRETQQAIPEDPGTMARTILYSLAVRYREVLALLEQLTGRSLKIIHIVGGGSHNALLNQMTADVTGRKIIAGPAEATAAGNTLIQAWGSGRVSSLEEVRSVVRNSFQLRTFTPQRT